MSAQPTAPASRPGRFPLLARVWPSIASLVLVALLAATASRPYRSFDTYFHLRFGAEFREGWSLSHPGQVSNASTNDWVPTQWLPQMVMSWVEDRWPGSGLELVLAALLATFAGALYLLLRRHVHRGAALILTSVVLAGCLPYLSGRPQVLSYVLLVGVLASWRSARQSGRAPWWLVPLAWVWATSHGMWALGVATSAVLALGVAWERRSRRSEACRLLAVPVAMLVASCLTPVGPRLVAAVLLVSSRSEHFAEWDAPELVSSLAAAPVTLLLVLALLLMLRRERVQPYDIALVGIGGLFAVYSQRTLPLALVVLAAIVAGEVEHVRRRNGRVAVEPPGVRERSCVALLAVAVVVVTGLLPLRDVPARQVEPFADLLVGLPAGSVVLTDRSTGAVLLWTHQDLDIPIHGYGDVYTDAELDAYDDLAHLEPGWTKTLDQLDAGVALLPDDDRVASALEDRGWQPARRAEGLVYLVAPEAAD